MSVCLLVLHVVWLVLVDSLVHQCHVSHACRYSAYQCFVWRNHVYHERCYCDSARVHVVMYCISALCMVTMYLLYYTASMFCINAMYFYCIISLHY